MVPPPFSLEVRAAHACATIALARGWLTEKTQVLQLFAAPECYSRAPTAKYQFGAWGLSSCLCCCTAAQQATGMSGSVPAGRHWGWFAGLYQGR